MAQKILSHLRLRRVVDTEPVSKLDEYLLRMSDDDPFT